MLRHATDADRDSVLSWRNHPEVREMSLTQHLISPAEHAAWWERTMADPSRRILIYERDGVASGVVTFFDVTTESAWWGYYLDNAGVDARGTRFPAWISIQREAVRYARDELGVKELHAETLADNEAALDFNKRQGFTVIESYPREDDASTRVVHTVRTF